MSLLATVENIETSKNIIISILESPITGSLVGIIGLIVTWITWRTTKKIEKRLPEEKAAALDKADFAKYRENCIKTIQNKRDAAQGAGKVSRNVCDDIIKILVKLQRFDKIISKDDMKILKEQQNEIQTLNNSKYITEERKLTQFIVVTTEIENILEKGVYKL